MKKFYHVTNQNCINCFRSDREIMKHRNEVVQEFFDAHGIDGREYALYAPGARIGTITNVDMPITEEEKYKICLRIEGTPNNKEKLKEHVSCYPNEKTSLIFRPDSELLHEFQDLCVERQVVVRHCPTKPCYFFTNVWDRVFMSHFFLSDDLYLMLDTDRYDGDDFEPAADGFEELTEEEYENYTRLAQALKKNKGE